MKDETQNKIDLVYGGFHMIPFKRSEVEGFCRYLENGLSVQRVAPAHCSGYLAFSIFQKEFGSSYIYAGLGETISYK